MNNQITSGGDSVNEKLLSNAKSTTAHTRNKTQTNATANYLS